MRKGKQGFLDYSSNIMFILQTSSENIINCALPFAASLPGKISKLPLQAIKFAASQKTFSRASEIASSKICILANTSFLNHRHPDSLGMSTPSARENQKTGIRPIQGIKIGLELTL